MSLESNMKISKIEAKVIDHMGSDLSVVNAARVSFHKESDWEWDGVDNTKNPHLSEKDTKLINYLAKHKHFSPFNHTFITARVKAPIFVARQLVKHKFMPWNEVSRRYVDEEPEFYFPDKWRDRGINVKQGSGDELRDVQGFPESTVEVTLECYNQLLQIQVAPEQARMVLPQNTMTEWIWSGTLGAYADMLRLRLDPHTQYESRIVAQQLREQIEPLFPVSLKALLND
jgi:thymidylate synthase (FAD)